MYKGKRFRLVVHLSPFFFSSLPSKKKLKRKQKRSAKVLSRAGHPITSYYETDPCLVRFVYRRRLQSAVYLTIGKKNLERRNLTE